MEVIDIDLNNISSASVPSSSRDNAVNFGGGLEFLMNDKKKSSSTKLDLGELDNLEAELNNLSSEQSSSSSSTKQLSGLSGMGFSNLFGFNKGGAAQEKTMDTDSNHLGQQTKETGATDSRTWDGFSKVNGDIPTQPTHLNDREKRRKKRMMIKKLEEWREKGKFSHGTQFDMNSAYDEVEDEYEGALEEKRKKDAIKLQGWWFTTVINTLEYGNALVNPFDLNLDGWGEQVSEDLDSYDEIFAELHEKYKGGKMAPEISLLLRVGFSAAVVNMSNKMLSSAAPGFGDVIKQSPELMKMFQGAAVNTMSKENSVFDFAKTMLNPPEKINTSYGPPPAPMETKNLPPQSRPGMQFTNRPDLAASKVEQQQQQQEKSSRPEMRGPPMANIDQLLSGLKQKQGPPQPQNVDDVNGDDSMISVTSLRDMNNATIPKRIRKRRNNSDKNSVVLDI